MGRIAIRWSNGSRYSPNTGSQSPGRKQQIAVAAHYSDGSVRDVTGMVGYESNQKEMAEVSKSGLVEVKPGHTGDLAVMIRFQELVGVFRATVPLGAPVDKLPPAEEFYRRASLRQTRDPRVTALGTL